MAAEIIERPESGMVAEQKVVEHSLTLFGTDDPELVVEQAEKASRALVRVVEQRQLYTAISGKKYPRVEAWMLLGSMLGVFPATVWTRKVDRGWEARVEARTRSGELVGAAECMCDRSEQMWAERDEHAIRSMAQTRAVSKALSMPLRFVMSLSGFEGTPAEEMPREETFPGQRPVRPRVVCPSCGSVLREGKTKKGRNPGSPYVYCPDAASKGCGFRPVWDTTLADYRAAERDFGNTVDASQPEPGPELSHEEDAIREIALLCSELQSEEVEDVFLAHGWGAYVYLKQGRWCPKGTALSEAPYELLLQIGQALSEAKG